MKAPGRELGLDIAENQIAGEFRPGVGITDRVESRGVIAAVVIARRREIGDAVSLHLIDRQGNDAV